MSLFSKYQPLVLNTPKWHVLDQVLPDIRRPDGLGYAIADFPKSRYNLFKASYRMASKRCNFIINETLSLQPQKLNTSTGLEGSPNLL